MCVAGCDDAVVVAFVAVVVAVVCGRCTWWRGLCCVALQFICLSCFVSLLVCLFVTIDC